MLYTDLGIVVHIHAHILLSWFWYLCKALASKPEKGGLKPHSFILEY